MVCGTLAVPFDNILALTQGSAGKYNTSIALGKKAERMSQVHPKEESKSMHHYTPRTGELPTAAF